MGDDPGQLSRRLCKALEKIGLSDNMRKMYRDASFYTEIINTICNRMRDLNMSEYRFGSSCEGTTTHGMTSDIDIVVCDEDYPVIDDIREAPPGEAFLILISRHTLPGYVKLQMVKDGRPLNKHNHTIGGNDEQYDSEGNVCLKHVTLQGDDAFVNERNGPADTMSSDPNAPPVDQVLAYRSKTFPQIASYSLEQCIACGWVTSDAVEKMKTFGILFVGVGFQSSVDREIEWRMSFSLQERELMLALHQTQHQCYFLLKTIKNLITAHPDVGKSLTSYHCKTCLFTVITNTNKALWREDNLIKCTFICLSTLKSWIYRGNCPNFFIPESNMFDRREFRQARERLLYYTRETLRELPRLIYQIETDHLGDALRGLAGSQIDEKRAQHAYDVLHRACAYTCGCQYKIIWHCHDLPSPQHITQYLLQQLSYLTTLDFINEHTQEQSQFAVQQFVHFMYNFSAQHIASAAFSTEDPVSRQQLLEASTRHLRHGKTCDVMTDKLLEATILYRKGQIEACRDVLEQTEREIMHGAVISHCECYSGIHQRNNDLKRNISSGHTNLQNVMESSVAPCMMFLPSQSEIIPKALQYEMYRSVFASPDTRDEEFSEWYDFVAVDSKIYLYFLQYLVHTHLNQPVGRRNAIDQIWKMFIRDPNLKHKETAYNLLCWIYIQEGRHQEAFTCLCLSWQLRPDHNAAKWHVMKLFLKD